MAAEVNDTGDSSRKEYIAFAVGDEDYCVEIDHVREIRRWSPATRLPRSPQFVSGVINLRGAVVPVIDFATRIGKRPSEPSERHSIIIVEVGDSLFGLLVDSVADILTASEKDRRPTPSVAAGATEQDVVRSLIVIDERMICIVDVAAAVQGAGLPERTAA